jgi:hypothetical protein
MDLARLRFGDWVMGLGGLAVLGVMFLEWYGPPGDEFLFVYDASNPIREIHLNAWEAFSVLDVVLALAAVMAIAAFVLTAVQPTAAVPLALSSLTTLVTLVAFVMVTLRTIWPPDIFPGDQLDTSRSTGAWLGLVATALLMAGCLASIRDERLPEPEHPVDPRLVQP